MERDYRFDFVNRDGSVDTFEIGAARDDGDAALRARSAMLVSLTAVAVEVWSGGERLCRIRRDSGPILPRPVLQALAPLPVPVPVAAASLSAFADDGHSPSATAASA